MSGEETSERIGSLHPDIPLPWSTKIDVHFNTRHSPDFVQFRLEDSSQGAGFHLGFGFAIAKHNDIRTREDHVEMKSIDTEYLETVKSSVVRVSGGIDWTSSCTLVSQIDHCLMVDHPAHLIVDLKDVFRIDSSGVGALVGGLQHAKRMHVQFTLCGVNPSLRRLLHRTCLDRLFEIRQTIAEALRVIALSEVWNSATY